jgi:hypothetical protein
LWVFSTSFATITKFLNFADTVLSAFDSSASLSEYSQTLRPNAPDDTLPHIVDIVDHASELIDSILPDSLTNITTFTKLASDNQFNFHIHLNRLLTDLSSRYSSLHSHISHIETAIQKATLNSQTSNHFTSLDVDQNISLKTEHQIEQQKLQEKVCSALSRYESQLTTQHTAATESWRAKIAAVEAQNAAFEKQLHAILQLSKLSPTEGITEEDRQLAVRIERANRLAKQTKKEISNEIHYLTKKI